MVKLDKIIKECAEDKIYTFPMRLTGQAFAETNKNPTRVTINLPTNICGKCLTDLNKWAFVIVAIEKEEWGRIFNKLDHIPDVKKKV